MHNTEQHSQSLSAHPTVINELPWLKEFASKANAAFSAKDILPLVSGLRSLFTEKNYSAVDQLLCVVELKTFSSTALATLARTTFPARDKLHNWDASLTRIQNYLKSRGEDADHILRGLT